ncbi:immunoglobulin-like and fibronectin type III domain-containing protein 1 isoform X2 [Chiroxiphia lanceolata]|uniref:immunoglobulin-like and fibronectin type III domain-containing protein 1 isoform X2 n=1 Tax=Chiroxiphia lanceolata TaxID=296741 RepID=UPI0013CE7E49|nr:immunoglobulin-like and fibronectin type III domain-containing protein 1 isoform X2 [Chiroxiphia lanceolata]
MTSPQAVKAFKKSAIPGVLITQFVNDVPEGCSTPDFERKPLTLTLQEGKNAIFRAVVKGVPTPEVKWSRTRKGMDDPAKYETSFNSATNEFILQINRLVMDDSDLYRCCAVNEYGEASCSVGLRIIQVGFKRKAKYVPVHAADELKKTLQDSKKLLRKRVVAPKPKPLDKEAVWQLLLHADRRDYEKICIKYGIVDFRGMLRKLQELRKDTESEQDELIHSIKNLEHIKVNKEGNATFSLEMELKNKNSNVYLLKDGQRLRYGTGDEYRKHCLRRIGRRYHFIVNDVQPEDAGVYQVRVEDVPVFSTELDAEAIPARFQQPLSDVRCPEEGDAAFRCVLRTPCHHPAWLHKTHALQPGPRHHISVSPDGLTHQLIIKNVEPSDSGMYTLEVGQGSSSAWLLVEYAKGKKRQDEEGIEKIERETSEWLKETMADNERARKLRRQERAGDEGHAMDTSMEKKGWYRKGQGSSQDRGQGSGQGSSQGHSMDTDDGSHVFLGKEGLRKTHINGGMGPGQFSGADLDGDSVTNDGSIFGLKGLGGKGGLRPVHDKDSVPGREGPGDGAGGAGGRDSVAGRGEGVLGAGYMDMDGGEGLGSQDDKDGNLGDPSSRAGFGGVGRFGATDGSSVADRLGPGSARVGDGMGDLFSRAGPGAAAWGSAAGAAGGMGSHHGKGGDLTVGDMNGAGINRQGQTGAPYGKDGLAPHASAQLGQGGRSGSLYGPGGLPSGDGALPGAGGSSVGEMEAFYGPDGRPLGAGAGGAGGSGAGGFGAPYGKDGIPAGAGVGGAGGGGFGAPYGKDGVLAGVGGVAGAGGFGAPYGKDGLPGGAGAGGTGGAGAEPLGYPYGKDGIPAGPGVGGAEGGGFGGVGSLYGKDGLPVGAGVGAAGVAGAGRVGSPYGKDGLPAGAGVGGAGGAGAGVFGYPYGKDGLPAGAGTGGAAGGGFGGVGSPYGMDGFPAGAGAAGVGGGGTPYGKDGLPVGAGVGGVAGAGGFGAPYGVPSGAGTGGAGVAGAGGIGAPYGKDGVPAGAGVGVAGGAGVVSPYGKDGVPAGAGVVSPYGKDGVPAGAGVVSPYGKDGVPAGAGVGVAGGAGVVSPYGMDGLPAGAVAGAAPSPFGGEGVMGSQRGRDGGLGTAPGYPGGAGGENFSMEGGGVGGSAAWDTGSPYGKDVGSAGAWAGAGAGGRLGGDGRDSFLGKEGMGGGGGPGGEYGKGIVNDARGSGNQGSVGDRGSLSGQGDVWGELRDLGQLGSLYGKDSAFGGAGSKSWNRPVDGSSSGGFGQGPPSHDQMSALFGGLAPASQRNEEPDVEVKAKDLPTNTESTAQKRRSCLDDLKVPRCYLNKQLATVRVVKGEPAELSCTVSKDDVTGTWFKDGLKLTSMQGVVFEKKGLVHKLIINKAEDIHAGKYRFEGGDVKTEASIFVEDPPQVDKVLLKNLSNVPMVAKAGQAVKLRIPFEGRLPVRATWLKDKMELADDTRIRVDKTDTHTTLSIPSCDRRDCGDYKVRLKNDSGVLEINLKLMVIDKPQPPAGPIKIVESSANAITIQWQPPKDDGGKPVQRYLVERQQAGKNDWETLGDTSRSCTTFTTNKVEEDTSYYFRVRAVNVEGTSDALESGEVKAAGKASPGAPDPPEIVSASRDTVTISWKAPRKTGTSQIVGYIVQKRKKGTMTWLPVTSGPVKDKKLKVTNLKKGVQYEFRVAAVNAAGTGDASDPSPPVFARDPTKSPGQVQELRVSSCDSTSVTLTWNRPEVKDGNEVKGYEVEMRPSHSSSWTKCLTLPAEATTGTIKGLQPKEKYFLRVRALNDSGPGEAAELEAIAEAAAPAVPPRLLIDDTVKNLLVVRAGNPLRVNIPFEGSPEPAVLWLKDGLPLPDRAAIKTQDGSTRLLIGTAELGDSGCYSVELLNGLGKRETFSFQVQITDIPQPPGPLRLEENVPNTVTVTWEPSASEKWEKNLYYTVLKRESQKGVWRVVGDLLYNNKFTFTSVIPGRDYYFRVVAKNSLGASAPSETVQPWRIRKAKAEIWVRPQRYRGVNQNQHPRFLVPLKPHVVVTGSECHMSCAVGGHPPPKVTWYKDNRDLSNDPNYFCTNDFGVCSLVILGVTKQDAGEYMVEASNEVGRVSSRAFLAIKDSAL